ncbi:MAG: hypothetical protein ACE5NC_09895 [Anaerolineae bacterium]
MPVTPFHLGPALLTKAAGPKWFSLGVFTVIQIAIDLEPVGYVLAGDYPRHAALHTLAGSVLLAIAAIVPAKYGLSCLYERIRHRLATSDSPPRWLVAELNPISWKTAMTGGLLGAISHVILDAVIHLDVTPFAPLSYENPFFVPYSFVWVHVLCGISGGLGLLIWLVRAKRGESASDWRCLKD